MGSDARAEERYYIVVPRLETPLSCAVIAVVAFATATLWGQGPNPRRTPVLSPQTVLVPAEPIWTISLDSSPIAGGAIDADHVYVPLRTERIVALSRIDGHRVWSRDIESTTVPVVAAGTVYVLASDELHALDAATGDQRWRVPFDHHLNLGLTIIDDTLLGVIEPSTVVALSASDGSIRWQRELAAPPVHSAVADAARVYLTLADASVVAVSRADGQVLWTRTLEGALAPPAVVADRLIVGSASNDVFALNTRSGSLAWRWRVGADVVGASGQGDAVFVTALDNLLRAVGRSSGNQRWKKAISSRPGHPPQVVGELVVVTSAAPTVSVYNGLTGALVGTYVAPGEIEGQALLAVPGVTGNVSMVIVTRDGRVVALNPKAPEPRPVPPVTPTTAPTTAPPVAPPPPGLTPGREPQP